MIQKLIGLLARWFGSGVAVRFFTIVPLQFFAGLKPDRFPVIGFAGNTGLLGGSEAEPYDVLTGSFQ